MKKYASVFAMLTCAVALIRQVEAAVQYWAISTHPCTVTDCDGQKLSFAQHGRTDGACYYIFNNDFGATDLLINESGADSTITANEPSGYRFKGWYTKTDGWTGDEASVSLVNTCIEATLTISGATIKNAGVWSGRPTIVAKYVPLYDIGTAVEPAAGGTVSGAGIYEEGDSATLKATANAGWAFEKWKDGVTANPRTLPDISAEATHTAVFKPLFREVLLERCDGTGGSGSVIVTNNLPLPKIQPPTRTGYVFLGYFTSASGDDATQYYTSGGASAKNWSADEKATALFARWQARKFTVKFNNDGATDGPEPIEVTYETNPGPLHKVPSKADYQFSGYYLDKACFWNASGEWVGGSGWTYIPEEGNEVVLTAHYTADRYTVKFNANGGEGSYADVSAAIDEEFTLPDGQVLSKAKHRFAGWAFSQDGAKLYDGGAKTTVIDNKSAASQSPNLLTFYAVWTDLSRMVRFNAGSTDATVFPATKLVEAGGTFGELATATWAGERCTLAGWRDANGSEVAETSSVPLEEGDIDLYALWTTNGYSIAFHENGGSGTMNAQSVLFYTSSSLSPNRFSRDGYQFAGWATNATDAVTYGDGDAVMNLATSKGEIVDLYAKWSANDYTVAFFGNGGTNTMETQAFAYDVEQGLSSNRFVREGFTFAGWATDPTNAVAHADGAKVTNLTAAANGIVPLYAKWTANGAMEVSDLSKAVGCDNLNLMTSGEGWQATGAGVRANIPQRVTTSYDLLAALPGNGTLTFRCKAEICAEPDVIYGGGSDYASQFVFWANGQMASSMGVVTNSVDWKEHRYENVTGAGSVRWSFTCKNPNVGDSESDGDYALIDFVRWEPAETNATTVGVTFRDAEGGVFTNVTRAAGEAYGELPMPTDALGRDFRGWECQGEEIDETWSVPNAAQGVEVRSRWGAIPVVTNDVPTAVGGLTYTGEEQQGVPEGDGYTIVGNVGTNAGNYTAWATPLDYHVWKGGFGGATNIVWTIAKAPAPDVSGVSFTDATYEYDGTERTIAVAGTVPAGVEVVYSGDATNRTEVGTNTVTASFKVLDEINYEAIATTLTAKLIITAKEEPPTPPDPPTPVVTNAVPVAATGLVYDGTEKTGVPAGENYTIVGNVATNAGDYVATATVTNGVWEGGATGATNIAWTIAKAPAPDVSGVSFADATYEYDGTERTIAVSGTVPAGVEVVYSGATNRTEVGTNTVTASFKVLDETNYEAVTATLTAKLIITAKEEPPPPPDPTVAYENIYFKATLAELGATAVPTNRKVTVKAEGLPKGLKLVTTALKNERNKATGFYAYVVEGVPTERMDGTSRRAYVRVTDDGVQTLYVLDLEVRPAADYERKAFPDGTEKDDYANYSVANLWPEVEEKGWSFSGWPKGVKYTAKDTATAGAFEVYGTPTKPGRFTVRAVEKIAGTPYKSTHVATFTVWPEGGQPEMTNQAYVGLYRPTATDVKSASGLPTGVRFTAKDISSKGEVVTEAHHFYGVPTKAGSFAVTLTHEGGLKTQFLWTITPASAPTFELQLSETKVDPQTAKATIRQGVAYDWPISATEGAAVTASGLPAGLKLVKTAVKEGKTTIGYTYSVAGVPTKAGEFLVTFTAKLNGVSTVTTAAFTVLDLPDWAQGTFDGGADETFAVGGQATFTVSKAGKLSGKWMSGGTNWTLSAASYDRYDDAAAGYVVRVVGKTGSGKLVVAFTNELAVAADALGGVATNELYVAYQNSWKQEPWKTIGKNVAKAPPYEFRPFADAGDDHTNDVISLKFAATGKVTVKASYFKSVSSVGKVSWTTASGSAVLCPQDLRADGAFSAAVFVYFPPKKGTPTAEAAYAACVRLTWDGEKFAEWVEPE